ncbi:MAG: type VI secretion system tip protein TssI/VgrG [Candidatus Thiodiazotropha sp.]
MSIFQAARQIRIHTPLGPNKLLIDTLHIHEELGRLFEIHADLLSEDDSITLDDLLAQKVDVELDTITGGIRIFNAFVTEFIQVGVIGDLFHYQAILHPWVWFLTRTSDCRIFQNLDATAIIKEVFGDNGFSDYELRLSHSYRTREYCVQFRETDFNFVSRLMEEEGIYYFFTHEAGKHTLVLCDDYASHTPISGGPSVLPFQPRPGMGGQRAQEIVSHWRISKGVRSGRYAHTDYDFKKPKADLLAVAPMIRSHPYADFEIFDYPGIYEQHGNGDQYARSRIEALQTHYEQLHGECDIRHLSVGGLFNLLGHPRLDQNREYLVTQAAYRIQADDYRSTTGSGEEPTYHCDFACVESKVSFRPNRATPKPMVEGPQTAVVVGPAGEEIYSDEYGRVKVQFHWDRYGELNENSSCWVRVAQVWAGKNWGAMHVPRIGQEVIVEFLDGDPDRPIITGRVYNAEQMPPWGLPANQTQSGILSRSSKGGSGANANALRFEDKKGAEEVWLHAEKDQRIEVENDESHWVGHDRTKTIDHDETSHIKHDRTETVDHDETITVHNNRTERVDHNETISIGDNRSEDVGKNETISIGQNRSETVGKNETIAIGKNRSETVGKNESVSVGGNQSVTVGKAKSESIALAKALSVGLGYQVSVGGAMNSTVGLMSAEQVGMSKSVNVGQDFTLTAGTQITLKVGSSELVMKADGTITLNGKDITTTMSGNVQVKAGGDITHKATNIHNN